MLSDDIINISNPLSGVSKLPPQYFAGVFRTQVSEDGEDERTTQVVREPKTTPKRVLESVAN